MKQTVIGIYDDSNKAREAEKELIRDGFPKDTVDISDNSNNPDSRDRSSSFFGSLFSDKDEARRHSDVAANGSVVTVHTQSMKDAERAAAILDKFGTIDVTDNKHASPRSDAHGSSASYNKNSDSPQGRTSDSTSRTSDNIVGKGDTKIPVIEEQMQVGKREVESGGARIRSRIVERPVEEHLRLREEHVNIDRKSVDRKANDTDLNTFKEGTIDATAHKEVPVVNKEARVVEEISINKDVSTRKETVSDSVRKTEVDVDKVRADKDRR